MRTIIFGLSALFVVASIVLFSLALHASPSGKPAVVKENPIPKPITAPMSIQNPGTSAPDKTARQSTEWQHRSETQIAGISAAITQLKDEQHNKSEPLSPTPNPKSRPGPETLLVINGNNFKPAQIEPPESARDAIDGILSVINAHPDDRILVEGYSDNYTADDSAKAFRDNEIISMLRAQAVARILKEKGITKNRITVRGHGARHPIASNATSQGRAQNRRVEIRFDSSPKP